MSEPKRAPITQARFSLRAQVNNDWSVTAEPDTSIQQITDPNYWSFVAASLRPCDTIHVVCEDGSWYALLLVVNTTRVSAIVEVLLEKKFSSAELVGMDDWQIKWRGPHAKWSIVNKENNTVLKDGFENQGAAMSHLAAAMRK